MNDYGTGVYESAQNKDKIIFYMTNRGCRGSILLGNLLDVWLTEIYQQG